MAKGLSDKTHQGGLYGSANSTAGNMALTALAELIGTYMLVLVGTAVACAASLHKNNAGPAYDSLAIALSFGLILIPIVGALGQVSGAHVNPAVTLGLAAAGKFPWRYVPAYMIAQMLGGLAASFTLWKAYGSQAFNAVHLGAPAPAHGATDFQVCLIEALIAFILVFTVMAMATDPRVPAGTASIAIGFSLSAGVLLAGPVSGGAGNPARALAPMILTHTYPIWYMYVLGPLLGGVIAAWLYSLVGRAQAPKVSLADQSTDTSKTRPNERFIP